MMSGVSEKMPGCVWTNESVTLLLSLYLREQQQNRPQKLKKKDVWRGICSELWSRGLMCSWQECDKKYRNLKQTFVRNLKQAGKKECRWIFFPLMLEINKHEPFVNEVVGSVLAQQSMVSDEEEADDDNCADGAEYIETAQAINLTKKRRSHTYGTEPNKRKRGSLKSPEKQTLTPPPELEPEHIIQLATKPATHIPLDVRLFHSIQLPSSMHVQHPFNSFVHQHIAADSCSNSNASIDGPPSVDGDNYETERPPMWFNAFMTEFRRHEHRKLKQIADLCAEVRRTNDIEHQRNIIMGEKNEILKSLNEYMINK